MLYCLTCLTGSSEVMLLLMMVICQGNDNIWQDETLGKLINPPLLLHINCEILLTVSLCCNFRESRDPDPDTVTASHCNC